MWGCCRYPMHTVVVIVRGKGAVVVIAWIRHSPTAGPEQCEQAQGGHCAAVGAGCWSDEVHYLYSVAQAKCDRLRKVSERPG